MNYVDHCEEQGVPVPKVPLVFSKFGTCIVGPGDGIPRNGPVVVTSKLDYEVELGIVIGTTVPRFTAPKDAFKFIGGYTVVHEIYSWRPTAVSGC